MKNLILENENPLFKLFFKPTLIFEKKKWTTTENSAFSIFTLFSVSILPSQYTKFANVDFLHYGLRSDPMLGIVYHDLKRRTKPLVLYTTWLKS